MNPPSTAWDISNVLSVPGSGRSPGRGHGNPLQYSCLENPTDRGVWQATVHMVAKSRTQLKQFSIHVHRELSNGRSRLEKRKMLISAPAAAAKSLQSCPTLCDPIDGSPPGSPVPGILQARTLEWVVISFFNAWKWKVKVKSLSRVQLRDHMDCSLPGSSIHGIFQARVLEWIAVASSLYILVPPISLWNNSSYLSDKLFLCYSSQ